MNPDTRKTYQYYKQKSGFTKNLEFHTKRIQNQTKSILILYWLFGKNKTFNRQTKFRVYRLTYFGMFGLDENRFKAFFHSMKIFLQILKLFRWFSCSLPWIFWIISGIDYSKSNKKILLPHWHWHHFNSAPWSMLIMSVMW